MHIILDPTGDTIADTLPVTVSGELFNWRIIFNRLITQNHLNLEDLPLELLSRGVTYPLKKLPHSLEDSIDLSIGDDIIDILSVVAPFFACLVHSDLIRNFFEAFRDLLVVASDGGPSIDHGCLPLLEVVFGVLGVLVGGVLAYGVLDVVVELGVDLAEGGFHDVDCVGDCLDVTFDFVYEFEDFVFIFPFDDD